MSTLVLAGGALVFDLKRARVVNVRGEEGKGVEDGRGLKESWENLGLNWRKRSFFKPREWLLETLDMSNMVCAIGGVWNEVLPYLGGLVQNVGNGSVEYVKVGFTKMMIEEEHHL